MKLTDGNLGITLLGEANDAGVLSANLGKLDLADVAELVAQRLPRPGRRHLPGGEGDWLVKGKEEL